MKSLYAFLVAIAASTMAATSPLTRQATQESPINFKLSSVGNSQIKVTITNKNQDTGYNLVKVNTLLDDDHVHKLTITNEGTSVNFTGFSVTYLYDQLDEESFFPLFAGQTREVVVDVAEGYWVHNTTTSVQEIVAKGQFYYAPLNSTDIQGSFEYMSNTLSVDIDQAEATTIFKNFLSAKITKRVNISPTCEGKELETLRESLKDCTTFAHAAAKDAKDGVTGLYLKYFYKMDWAEVQGRLQAIGDHCTSLGVLDAVLYCRDPFGGAGRCNTKGVAAFARDKEEAIVFCPAFFDLPAIRYSCNGFTSQSRAGVIIHEMTHMGLVYWPICSDYAYGTAKSQKLSPDYAASNADSHVLYAMDLKVGCK
ncbi:Neutral protease 2 [Pyrenophora tritici-repentis]|nr:Neutral protease 2 [Pyrenophora tritici-repentis]KAI0606017.1 Neutral protease 2 [Pyrenophora tritici-repentis]KAI0618137.1 Neutral protease 2 [Pyrenophora tritici-repentis]